MDHGEVAWPAGQFCVAVRCLMRALLPSLTFVGGPFAKQGEVGLTS